MENWQILILILVGIPVVSLFALLPLLGVYTYHKRKMEQLRLQRDNLLSQHIANEFAAVREEIKALRDTSMQYDLSFDTALHQIERRVNGLERETYRIPHVPPVQDQNVTLGGR